MAFAFSGQEAIQALRDVASLLVSIICSVQAYRYARGYDKSRVRPWFSRWYGLAGIAGVLAFVVIGTRAFFYEPFRVPATSMAPSIEPGAYIVVKKWGYGNYAAYGVRLLRVEMSQPVRSGDVIVFEHPQGLGLQIVKRVVGLPGDRVSYFKKRLRINGSEVPVREAGEYRSKDGRRRSLLYRERIDGQEHDILIDPGTDSVRPPVWNFAFKENCDYRAGEFSCLVPDAHYFVLGDNRDHSDDSRAWGFVPARMVVGKVEHIFQ